jgi:hypothetical protein
MWEEEGVEFVVKACPVEVDEIHEDEDAPTGVRVFDRDVRVTTPTTPRRTTTIAATATTAVPTAGLRGIKRRLFDGRPVTITLLSEGTRVLLRRIGGAISVPQEWWWKGFRSRVYTSQAPMSSAMRPRLRIVIPLALVIIVVALEAPVVPVTFYSGSPPHGGAFTVWKSPLCWLVGSNPHAWVGFTYVPGMQAPLFQSCLRDDFLG